MRDIRNKVDQSCLERRETGPILRLVVSNKTNAARVIPDSVEPASPKKKVRRSKSERTKAQEAIERAIGRRVHSVLNEWVERYQVPNAEAADVCEMSQTTLNPHILGNRKTSALVIRRLNECLGVNLKYLLYNDDTKWDRAVEPIHPERRNTRGKFGRKPST